MTELKFDLNAALSLKKLLTFYLLYTSPVKVHFRLIPLTLSSFYLLGSNNYSKLSTYLAFLRLQSTIQSIFWYD